MTAVVDCHSERSRHFLDLVDDELDLVDDEADRGELEEASNKLWGAAAHAIKVVAERRGVVSRLSQRPGGYRDALD